METSTTVEALGLRGLAVLYGSLSETYASGGPEAVVRQHGLVLATVVLALVILLLLAVIVLMPSRRKVVVRRRVRVTRQAVASNAAPPTVEDAQQPAVEESAAPEAARPAWKRWGVPVVWGVIVLAAFVGTYAVTGSNGYCGQSCHVEDPHVVTAVVHEHADCIDCHESGPVSGGVARLRMAVAYVGADEVTSSQVPSIHRVVCVAIGISRVRLWTGLQA